MSGRSYSRADDRYDSGDEVPLDRYDPNEGDIEGSSEQQPVESDERQDSSRERHGRHGTSRGEREERRHRRSFGSRFLMDMMQGIKESMDGLRDSVREAVGTARPTAQTRPRPRFEASLPQPQSQVPSREQAAALRGFQRLNPPTFNGGGDPRAAEEWLERINQYLNTLGIRDGGQRVSLAVFQFTGEARHWWRVAGRAVGDSWKEFQKSFHNKYIPTSAVNRLRSEFEELTQGDKSVDVYASEFSSLSRYAPELMADEGQLCRRFENGLRAPIRDRVLAQMYSDFDTLVESARAVERGWERTQKEREGRRLQGASGSRGASSSNKRKSSGSESSSEAAKRPARASSSSRGARRSTSDRPLVCRLCDQHGHIMAHCPRFAQARASVSGPRYQQPRAGGPRPIAQGGVTCYQCHQPGHYKRDCPTLVGASQGASTGSAPTQQSQRFQQTPAVHYARPQAQFPRVGGRGGSSGKGKMAALAVEDEPGTYPAYPDPAGPTELRGRK